jgi:prolipoprotein diacylglyceryltransferase
VAVSVAVIAFDFDPFVRFADRAVRLETILLATTILLAMLCAAILAGRTRADRLHDRLRRDDLLFIILGVVPGAVVGGRLGYGLLHLDYYAGHPQALLDAGQGGFELGLAVLFGMASGVYVCWLLEAPIGRWAHVSALPTILGLGLGKLAMAVGGSGQGLPSDASWATAYLGPGPWGSLAPAVPSMPSQLFEAGVTAVVGIALICLVVAGAFRRADGRLLLLAVGLWAVGRVVVAFSWRDVAVLGPLRMDQLISVAIVAICVAGLALRARPVRDRAVDPGSSELDWPDPDAARSWRSRPIRRG